MIPISCVEETFPEIETRLIGFFGFGPGVHFITSQAGKPPALRLTNDGRVNGSERGSRTWGRQSLYWAQLRKRWLAHPGTEADADPGVVGTQQTSARLAGVRPGSSEEKPRGPAALPGNLSLPSAPAFAGKLFKVRNSPSLSLQNTLFTTTLFPFLIS